MFFVDLIAQEKVNLLFATKFLSFHPYSILLYGLTVRFIVVEV